MRDVPAIVRIPSGARNKISPPVITNFIIMENGVDRMLTENGLDLMIREN